MARGICRLMKVLKCVGELHGLHRKMDEGADDEVPVRFEFAELGHDVFAEDSGALGPAFLAS